MFRWMEQEELRIQKLKDLKMVHFYSLAQNGKDVPAIACVYGANEQINLSSLDAYYSILLDRLIEIYPKEKRKSNIVMDEHTKTMLELFSGTTGVETRKMTFPWMECATKLNDPLYSQESYSFKTIASICEYILKEIYSLFGKEIRFSDRTFSWHRKARLLAWMGTEEIIFPIQVEQDAQEEYLIFIGHFIAPNARLSLRIVFHDLGVRLFYSGEELGLSGYSFFEYSQESGLMKEEVSITLDGKEIYRTQKSIAPEKKPIPVRTSGTGMELGQFLRKDEGNRLYFCLPWEGATFMVHTHENETKASMTYDTETCFFTDDFGCQNARISSFTKIESRKNGLQMNNILYRTDVYYHKKTEETQVSFRNVGFMATGEYKRQYEGTYYLLGRDEINQQTKETTEE